MTLESALEAVSCIASKTLIWRFARLSTGTYLFQELLLMMLEFAHHVGGSVYLVTWGALRRVVCLDCKKLSAKTNMRSQDF